MLNDLDEKL